MICLGEKHLPLLLILLFAVFLQSIWLSADPPSEISWSNGIFTDPGIRATEARNIILFGSNYPLGNQEIPYFMSPLLTSTLIPWFSVFGIGYAQLRVLSILFYLFSVIALYVLSKEVASRQTATIAVFLFAFSFPVIMYGKYGLLEVFAMPFLILSMLFAVKSITFVKDKSLQIIACQKSGKEFALKILSLLFFFMAFLFKPTSLVLLPVLGLLFLVGKDCFLSKKKLPSAIVLMALLVTFLSLTFFFDPRFFDISGSQVPAAFGASAIMIVRNILLMFANNLFAQTAVIFSLALVASLFAVFRLAKHGFIKITPKTAIFMWFFFSTLGLSLLSYQPPRYFLIILPPMCFLAADAISHFATNIPNKTFFSKKNMLFFIPWLLVASFWIAVSSNKFIFAKAFDLLFFFPTIFIIFLITSYLICRFLLSLLSKRNVRKTFVLGIFLLFVLSSVLPFANWAMSPNYSLTETANYLEADVGPEAIVIGFSTNWLCIETSLKCIPMFNTFNNKQPFERFKPSHLIIQPGLDDELLDEIYPNGWRSRLEFIKNYYVGRDELGLYRLIG